MIVLIIIIAVISSVAVPAYARYHAWAGFQRSVRETTALLAEARDRAVQASADCRVRFDAQTETFMVTVETLDSNADLPTALQESPDAAPPEPRLFRLGEDIAVADFQVYRPSSASASGPGSAAIEFHFYEDGRSDGARFALLSQDGYRALVEVSPATGRVTVRDENEQ